jgi:hypothetical protein
VTTHRLGGTDEAYLLLESTVGVVAPMQVVVVLDDDPGAAVADDLVAGLVGGPLDRAVRAAVVPGARPRWTRPTGDAHARVDTTPVDDAVGWASEHLRAAPVDVMDGRGWQVATVALTDGGRAISVVASHVLSDGRRFVATIADAVSGLGGVDGVADPTTIEEPGRVRAFVGDVPDATVCVVDAVRSAMRLVRSRTPQARPSVARRDPVRPAPGDHAPTHHVVTLDRVRWHEVARDHGGTRTALLVAVGAGAARRGGVVAARGGPDAAVRLALTVDRREAGDTTTANTAGGVMLTVPRDPTPAIGLVETRADIRSALSDPPADDAIARIARLLPGRVLGRVVASLPGPDVSVSHLGEVPESLLSWRGRRVRTLVVRAAPRSAPAHARAMLPGLALWAVEYDDAITVAVCATHLGDGADLAEVIAEVLARWGSGVDARRG